MKQTATRPIASLTISFGLVAIPVKLYSAIAASERISFLHAPQVRRIPCEGAIRRRQ